MSKILAAFLSVVVSTAAAAGQGIGNLTISGNQVTASVDLPGISADLTLTFEQVTGLTASNLGLSAQIINPTDLNLLSRLPAGGLVTVPGALPLLVQVQPPASGGLSFTGIYTFDVHTSLLEYFPNCPLRLFAAPAGGAFTDITASMGSGSYRVRGTRGSFSDFLILVDLRPLASVISQKFDALSGLLSTYGGAISVPVLNDLTSRLQTARAYYQAGDNVDAANAVNGFATAVQNNSGTAIPNVWSASGGPANVAGQLRAAAGTLSFSLGLSPAGP